MKVYFDHNATTMLDPIVLEKMMPYLTNTVGNPTSVHQFGRFSRSAIEGARAQVASLVNVRPSQVIFTSGGTESDNLALQGYAKSHKLKTLAVSAIEHKAVIYCANAIAEASGCQLQIIKVNQQGVIDEFDYQQCLKQKPELISIMLANNETGALQNISHLAELAHDVGAIFHCDAVQALGKIRVDFDKLGIDMMSISSHKIGGPTGVGALILQENLKIDPLFYGGGQELNMRSGSHHIAGIVGFGQACELAEKRLTQHHFDLLKLQHHFEEALEKIPKVTIFSKDVERLPNTTFFSLPHGDSDSLVLRFDMAGFAVSGGSACGHQSISPVLAAMNVDEKIAQSAMRVSFSHLNTEQEVDAFVKEIENQLASLNLAASQT